MESRSRQHDLQALGLTEWTFRSDGPFSGALRPGPGLRQRPKPAADMAQIAGSGSSADRDKEAPHEPETIKASAEGAPAKFKAPMQGPRAADEDGPGPDLSGMDWAALESYLAGCDHRGAARPVFGVGARAGDVLIVGEAPGANEDQQGVPFVGRAGKLLDRMLFAIGCSREHNVYITNICKFRPPDNRDPTAAEVAADWPILERQIELMAPRLVVALGRVAAQTLLDSKEPLGKLRGRMHRYPQRELDVLVTYHPAYLLRSPQQKARAWDDLRMIARCIGDLES